MRCIDADRLLTDKMKSKYYHLPNGDIAIPLIDIKHAPTIEPERKKGKWILVTDTNGQHCVCDHCGEWKYHQEQKFCGECGYAMTEEGD